MICPAPQLLQLTLSSALHLFTCPTWGSAAITECATPPYPRRVTTDSITTELSFVGFPRQPQKAQPHVLNP
eukprot:3362127-Amphidinium_carterae.1